MILIPGGPFIMGRNKENTLYFPEMKFNLRSFQIDRTEVSNAQYKKFIDRLKRKAPPSWVHGNIPRGEENRPVVKISWDEARQYCRFRGKRLPTESEWEKAFRGPDGNRYPWKGDNFHKSYARTSESGKFYSVDVDTNNYDVSPYGVMHMAGNVREWVMGTSSDSRLLPYKGNRFRASKFGLKPIRGGSFGYPQSYAVGWFRDGSKSTYAWPDVGFRCAK
jgi:formylglycine-generating enzyme required for sulfatase activity